MKEGDRFERPSAGGGGLGDPLERDPDEVLEDVADGYVTIKRAALDYGVVVEEVDVELAEYQRRRATPPTSSATSSAAPASPGSTRTPRTSRSASATASSTCSTSSATTA